METGKYIFIIDAEQGYNVLIRIMTTLNRHRIHISELHSQVREGDDRLRIMVSVQDKKENMVKLSRRLDREIDIISVNVYERLN
jgi:hypothetical protein